MAFAICAHASPDITKYSWHIWTPEEAAAWGTNRFDITNSLRTYSGSNTGFSGMNSAPMPYDITNGGAQAGFAVGQINLDFNVQSNKVYWVEWKYTTVAMKIVFGNGAWNSTTNYYNWQRISPYLTNNVVGRTNMRFTTGMIDVGTTSVWGDPNAGATCVFRIAERP